VQTGGQAMSRTSDIFHSPTEIRERELQRRKDIVTELQNLPVPEGSKAYDIIWGASHIIEAYELELETNSKRNAVLKARLVELEARLDCYFGVEVQQ
jgi:hypothetical protein